LVDQTGRLQRDIDYFQRFDLIYLFHDPASPASGGAGCWMTPAFVVVFSDHSKPSIKTTTTVPLRSTANDKTIHWERQNSTPAVMPAKEGIQEVGLSP